MLEVTNVCFEELTEDERDEQPNNGNGKEYADYLKITYGGNTIAIHSDAMEPEDCGFRRDLRWIEGLIVKAYELGKGDS